MWGTFHVRYTPPKTKQETIFESQILSRTVYDLLFTNNSLIFVFQYGRKEFVSRPFQVLDSRV